MNAKNYDDVWCYNSVLGFFYMIYSYNIKKVAELFHLYFLNGMSKYSIIVDHLIITTCLTKHCLDFLVFFFKLVLDI